MASHDSEPTLVQLEVTPALADEVRRLRKAVVAMGVAIVGLLLAVGGLVAWNATQETRLTVTGNYILGKGDQRDAENAERAEELRLLACRLLAGTETWGNVYYDGLREEYGCLPQPSLPPSNAPSTGTTAPASTPASSPSSTTSTRTPTAAPLPTTTEATPGSGASESAAPTSNSGGTPGPTLQPTTPPAGSVPSDPPPRQVCVLQLVCLPL